MTTTKLTKEEVETYVDLTEKIKKRINACSDKLHEVGTLWAYLITDPPFPPLIDMDNKSIQFYSETTGQYEIVPEIPLDCLYSDDYLQRERAYWEQICKKEAEEEKKKAEEQEKQDYAKYLELKKRYEGEDC